MTEKKPRKKYPKETTVRFNTDEAKVLLMAMNYSKNREIFTHEGLETESRAYVVMHKLKDRIEKERQKRDKVVVVMEVKDENQS